MFIYFFFFKNGKLLKVQLNFVNILKTIIHRALIKYNINWYLKMSTQFRTQIRKR